VLVVDDNAAAREVMASLLTDMGLSPVCVASGEAAVEAARVRPFHAAFVDWRMPGMDGLETARQLRQLDQPPRIVMVTAFGRDDVRGQAQAAGIEAFLVKPVSQSALLDTIVTMFAVGGIEAVHHEATTLERQGLGGARLLLAEDNDINQQIAVELLESAGARVDVANNGREAVDLLDASAPDTYQLVLMDVQMPVMDGIEATRRIRSDPRYASLPILALTASAMAAERVLCVEAGMNDHIAKPIDPEAMFQTIAHWIGGRMVAAALSPVADDEHLPEIAGLDAADGLRRVGGNRRLYRDLLRQFAGKQADASDRVSAAMAAGNFDAAQRIAHSVKGVAGNLGIGDLFTAAGVLEKALQSGGGVDTALKVFGDELARTTAALRAATPAPIRVETVAEEGAASIAAKLASMLAAGTGDAAEYFEAHRAAIGSFFDNGGLATLEKALGDFDHETALQELRWAASTRGVKLQGEPT
jgi:two-component system sensor histidine kinase/response regulator